jgi:uncharacterized membrane protein YeaQ/YmgE (transglycosylase-associated protein family)
MWIFLYWLITAIICGFVASYVASQRGADSTLGFLGGLLIGPLGIVVAAYMDKEADTGSLAPPSEDNMNLDSVSYKEFLVFRYGIRFNVMLQEYVFNDRSYVSINEPLALAHEDYAINKSKMDADYDSEKYWGYFG